MGSKLTDLEIAIKLEEIEREEPKQDRTCNNNCSDVCGECQIFEPKQETLEEAAEKYSEELLQAKTIKPHEKSWIKAMFIWVAKWQAQKTTRRSTERKDRNGVEIFEGDYLVDRYEDSECLYEVVYCPRLMAWAVDVSYAQDGSCTESIHEFFGDYLEVKGNIHEGS